MPEVFVDEKLCKGCGLCVEFCPRQVLKLADEPGSAGYTTAEPVDLERCTSCGICYQVCPDYAIAVKGERRSGEKIEYSMPKALSGIQTSYCPGCTHGVVHRIIAEVIDELDIKEKTIGVTSIGCSIFIYKYLDVDYVEGAHGRAPAVATGVKNVHPDNVVFTYQGDGDIGAIGTAEIIHAAVRGENITAIFVNNGNYGMTGGQMAPTTLMGHVTTTSPGGRDESHGHPLHVADMLATIKGDSYLVRGSADTPRNIRNLKKYVKRAFQRQVNQEGFSLVEVLGICPTNWGKSVPDSFKLLQEEMMAEFPLGEIKVPEEVE